MGEFITITAQDGFSFSAFEAKPQNTPKGGIVILQEIFGVNAHIQDICNRYAAKGYHTIAPALFDRSEKDIALAYDQDGIAQGRAHKEKVDAFAEADILACLNALSDDQPKAVIGYCWGGSLAWRMACRHDGIDVAIAYYGGELPSLKDETPRCRVQTHFGEKDPTIPMEGVHAFIAAQPDAEHHLYDAGHGFNCDRRSQYDDAAAALAQSRVDAFLNF